MHCNHFQQQISKIFIFLQRAFAPHAIRHFIAGSWWLKGVFKSNDDGDKKTWASSNIILLRFTVSAVSASQKWIMGINGAPFSGGHTVCFLFLHHMHCHKFHRDFVPSKMARNIRLFQNSQEHQVFTFFPILPLTILFDGN